MSSDGDGDGGGVGVIWARAVACRVSEHWSESVTLHFGTLLAHSQLFVFVSISICSSPFLPHFDRLAMPATVCLSSSDYWLLPLNVAPVSCHCILNTLSFVLWIFNLYRAQRWRLSRCTASSSRQSVFFPTALWFGFWCCYCCCHCCCHFASSEWASAFSASFSVFSPAYTHCHLY